MSTIPATSTLVDAIRERQSRIDELRRELAQLEAEMREARLLFRGQGRIPRAPRHGPKPRSRHGFTNGRRAKPIQPNSSVDWTERILRAAGEPLHLDTIIARVKKAGGPIIKKATLASNLSRYVTHGDTFTRPAPNTFALVDADMPADERPDSDAA
jgi:hypothetical protein